MAIAEDRRLAQDGRVSPGELLADLEHVQV